MCYRRGGTEPTVTDADLVLGRLDPAAFWSGRLDLDLEAARQALATVGKPLGLDAEEAAVATVAIIDAHMCDAVRRILSLAGADARELDLVAFGGMGAVHAARHAALLGMRRVLIPRAAPAFSALGLLTANHVIDEARTLQGDWRTIDLGRLSELAEELMTSAEDALEAAGIPAERRVYEWRINLVYPGQTFDVAIPIDKAAGSPISQESLEAAVSEFHRRNEEARLIEARSQEPVVRGVRLLATGLVDQPAELVLEEEPASPSRSVAAASSPVRPGTTTSRSTTATRSDPVLRWPAPRSCRAGSRRLCSGPATRHACCPTATSSLRSLRPDRH